MLKGDWLIYTSIIRIVAHRSWLFYSWISTLFNIGILEEYVLRQNCRTNSKHQKYWKLNPGRLPRNIFERWLKTRMNFRLECVIANEHMYNKDCYVYKLCASLLFVVIFNFNSSLCFGPTSFYRFYIHFWASHYFRYCLHFLGLLHLPPAQF